MPNKRKKKPELVMVGALVPPEIAEAVKGLARDEDRTVSKTVKKLIEDSPDIQRRLKQAKAA